jgi:hypothetical protein
MQLRIEQGAGRKYLFILSRAVRWFSTSRAIPMRIRDAIKQGHERAVAEKLLKTLKIDATFERKGDPNKDEPDVIYKIEDKTVGIEVATAYYEDSDAKDEWEIATGENPLAPGEIRPRSGGVIGSPDRAICERIQAELEDKCRKTYAGVDETWLSIEQNAALSDARSTEECVKNLKVPADHKFSRIYLTYDAPLHDGSGYTALQIG